MYILVTGGTGLVGAHLLVHLRRLGKSVRATYRKTSDREEVKRVFSYYDKDTVSLFDSIEWVEADITDLPTLDEVFNDVDEVYHCAAKISFIEKDEQLMRKINIEGTANIVNLSIKHKVQKFCYVSSVATINKSEGKNTIDETNEWNPEEDNNAYAISKYGAEMEVWRASQEGLDIVIVNPGVILGSGFWQNNAGKFFINASNNFKYYPTGIFGFVGVQDVVKAMLQLMKSSVVNQRFVLVSENSSFQYVMTKIAEVLGTKPPTVKITPLIAALAWRAALLYSWFTGTPPILTKRSMRSAQEKMVYSSDKLRKTIGFEFETLEKTIERAGKNFLLR